MSFNEQGYIIIQKFFDPFDVYRMNQRLDFLRANNLLTHDPQCPGSYSVYADPIHSEMQEKYRYKLQAELGIDLFPTYTYARSYVSKEVLTPHKDRPACEISLTTTLSFDTFDDRPWPIFIENRDGKAASYHLYPGDILVYSGCDLSHWRESFVGVKQNQLFIHYVNAKGKHKKQKYDGRPSLGSSVATKKM